MENFLKKGYVIGNRYRVSRVIGQGGMGRVYLVRDLKEKSTCVVKEFHSLHDQVFFSREASFLLELSHWGLPRVIDYFTENKKNYLILERVEGLTFEEIVEKDGPLLYREILPWSLQLCNILNYLHTRDPPVIFRDLKPGNIMLNIDGMIRLVDFGIARFYDPQKEKDTTPYGTPGYAPPEQCGRAQTDQCSDIYSLGATLYFMLTAIEPATCQFNFAPLKEVDKKIPFEVSRIVMKCLELKPENRYQDILELEKDLKLLHKNKDRFVEKVKDWFTGTISKKL